MTYIVIFNGDNAEDDDDGDNNNNKHNNISINYSNTNENNCSINNEVRRVFHLSLRLIIFGGRSVHLAYSVYKSGRKTAITFILTMTIDRNRLLLV